MGIWNTIEAMIEAPRTPVWILIFQYGYLCSIVKPEIIVQVVEFQCGSGDCNVDRRVTVWILGLVFQCVCWDSRDPEIPTWILVLQSGSFGNSVSFRIKVLNLGLQCGT